MEELFPEEYNFLFDICKDISLTDTNNHNKFLLNNKKEFFEKLFKASSYYKKNPDGFGLLCFCFRKKALTSDREINIDFRYFLSPIKLYDIAATDVNCCRKFDSKDIEYLLKEYPDLVFYMDVLEKLSRDFAIKMDGI